MAENEGDPVAMDGSSDGFCLSVNRDTFWLHDKSKVASSACRIGGYNNVISNPRREEVNR